MELWKQAKLATATQEHAAIAERNLARHHAPGQARAQIKESALLAQHNTRDAATAAFNPARAHHHAPGELLEHAQAKAPARRARQRHAQAYCLEQEEQRHAQALVYMTQ